MSDYREDFERVKSLVPLREYVAHILGPTAKNGQWNCPFHDDKKAKLGVKGKGWRCWSSKCGETGDVVSFAAQYHKVSQGKAKKLLKEWASITDDQAPAVSGEPKKEEQESDELPDGWKHFVFHNAEGEEVGAEIRKDFYDYDQRKTVKVTRLYHKHEGQWVNRALAAPRPLYRLHDMVSTKGTAPLYVVEGPKCAEAVIAAGQRATTWMGGTNALHHTDFSSLLEAAKTAPVVLISDGDAPGRKAMRTIRKILIAGEYTPEFYSMSGIKGYDIADILKAQGGNWDVAFPLLQSRCPSPDKLPPIIADDILDEIKSNKEFEVLGYQEKSIVIIRKSTGKVIHQPSNTLTDGQMTQICPQGHFWTRIFENPRATLEYHPRREAHRALTIVSEERGLWQPKNQIGRGLVHIPDEGYFFHMGDRVEPMIMEKDTDAFSIGEKSTSRAVFSPRPPLKQRPGLCRPQEFKVLNDALNEFSWRDNFGGTLLLSWVCAALLGGATYRPHLRLVSPPDMGKNWLLDAVILPVLGDMYNDGGGDASVAGISAKVKGDALPFIMNEANPNSRRMREKMSELQNLILGSYDPQGTPTLRATQDGEMREAYVRCNFLMASNQVIDESEANASRTFQLSMTGKLSKEEWRELERRVDRAVESYGPGIRSLMMSRADVILADIQPATNLIQDDEQLSLRGRESRNVALLAACHANLYPHEEKSKRGQILLSARQIVAAMGQRVKVKTSIIDPITTIRDQKSGYSLKEAWVAGHEPHADSNRTLEAAVRNLRIAGVFIADVELKDRGKTMCLLVNPASSTLRNHLAKDQTWAGVDIAIALSQEPGADSSQRRRFGGDPVKAYAIPLSWKLGEDEMPATNHVQPFESTNIKDGKIVGLQR